MMRLKMLNQYRVIFTDLLRRRNHQTSINVTFKDKSGSCKTYHAKIGDTILEVAHKNGIDLEGACEGVCACSTCHVYVDPGYLASFPDASEDEEDMLDQAFGLKDNSRLGCQLKLMSQHEGLLLQLPTATRNFYVDGHKPKPH